MDLASDLRPICAFHLETQASPYRQIELISADAAGISVCLLVFSQLSFEYTTDVFAKHFHWLRDFASNHPEARMIFRAID